MGTSVGPAIDYLVTGLTSGITTPDGVAIPGLSSIDGLVEVADSLPTKADGSWVIVGRTGIDQGEAAVGVVTYGELGATRIVEEYTLSILIVGYRPGPGQKAARDAVVHLYDGVVKFVHADPTLGGLLLRGRLALASRFALDQTQDDAASGNGLVTASMPVQLDIRHTYIP